MSTSIEIIKPSGSVVYTEGVADCQHIQVKFYFANVVQIVISFTTGSRITFYQVPCILTQNP
jgi:hypothetical protein